MKGTVMKKILLSLLLVACLMLSVALVSCGDDYDDSESRLPVDSTESDSGSGESGSDSDVGSGTETEKEPDSALGVVEDTEEGWSEIHH